MRRLVALVAVVPLCTAMVEALADGARQAVRQDPEAQGEEAARRGVLRATTPPRARCAPSRSTKPSGDIWLRAENLGEEVTVNIYKPDGTFDEAALAKLDDLFRCVRTGEVRAVRPELYEQLSRIYDHFDRQADLPGVGLPVRGAQLEPALPRVGDGHPDPGRLDQRDVHVRRVARRRRHGHRHLPDDGEL